MNKEQKKINSDEEKYVHAPYNFVPFSNKVIERYQSVDDLPHHNVIDKKLKTGEIRVRMKAITPISVSGTDHHFFKGPNGHYQIPGSTFRGMIRENIQILGFGLMKDKEDLENYKIYFRDMASAKNSAAEDVKEYYTKTLDVDTKTVNNSRVSIPKRVQAGYLFCERNEEGKYYYIKPVKGTYLRVSRKNPGIAKIGYAEYHRVAYQESPENEIEKIVLLKEGETRTDKKTGILLSTGKPVGNKPNHCYVFPEVDQEVKEINISSEDILSYKEDLEKRSNSLKGAKYNLEFWQLPEEGENKAVFYMENGGISFGMSLFLRIVYPHGILEGLPDSHKNRANRAKVFLDYPRSMFGFTENKKNKENKENKEDKFAYRSRISFGNLDTDVDEKEITPYKAILGEPRPSFYPGYLGYWDKNSKTPHRENYIETPFRLRGYKQYWLKDVLPEKSIKNENVASTFDTLPKGTVFEGSIHYKNLHIDELGLLLWALRLEKDCFQSVGMGKPLGFGCMQLEIEALNQINYDCLYHFDSIGNEFSPDTEHIDEYIKEYQKYASQWIARAKKGEEKAKTQLKEKEHIENFDEIKDFFFIHKKANLSAKETSYMDLDLGEYTNIKKDLKFIQEIREKEEEMSEERSNEKKIPENQGELDLSALSGMMKNR